MKIIAVIPARYQSSRFEGKPLADICGQPMIWWVYQQVKKVVEFNEVYVATDDIRIESVCKKLDINVVMTSSEHKTGTDRIGEVSVKVDADIYVNVQGDEPLIEPDTIRKAILPFLNGNIGKNIMVTNLMTEIKEPVDLLNNTVPKVIANANGIGVYVTRVAAPYPKGRVDVKYYKQVCVYGFTPEALAFYCNTERGYVESIEDIEILRFIENGVKVQYIEVDSDTIAVDTPNDLKRVVDFINSKKVRK